MFNRVVFSAILLASLCLCPLYGDSAYPESEVSSLVERLRFPDTRDRAVRRLKAIGPSIIPRLDKVLSGNGNPELKIGAVCALIEIEALEADAPLRRALTDSDSRVRLAAAVGVCNARRTEGVANKAELWDILRSGLLDENCDVRNSAVECLARMDLAAAVPLLIETLDREFKKPPEKRGRRQLPGISKYDGEDATISACRGWLGVTPRSVAPIIEANLGKSSKDLDYCLACVLLTIGQTPYQTELLVEGARECSSTTTRVNILDRLWKVTDPRVVGVLEDALHDPYSVTVPETHKTIYPIQMAADRSLRRVEAKANGLDPLSVDRVPLPPDIHVIHQGPFRTPPAPSAGQ